METDPETFTDDVLMRMATGMQIDEVAFKTCLTSPETEARIQSDRADYKACKGAGLPTLYVGSESLVGLQSLEELDTALTRAKER
jgi:predicted DsbA family dithiol-disulfide isomerase